jgi:mannose-6-phosphate isomerase-like protein (cupin superfamily)
MKVALVGPRADAGPLGEQIALLARGLKALDIGVIQFTCQANVAREEFALSEAFARAAEFDLIHSFLRERALLCAGLVATPVLSTLDGALSPDRAALRARVRERTWFVSSAASAQPPAGFLAVIEAGKAGGENRFAREYLEVYARILELDMKRRTDSGHDRRPWGEYLVLIDDPHFKVKRIDVLAGKRLSYQRHKFRSEHWTVVSGQARVTLDGVVFELSAQDSIEIPIGAAHRVENPGQELLSFIEVQRGSYFGEDDIERLSDDFGRA